MEHSKKAHYTNLYEKAVEIATQAHQGQTRWDGSPYITHPLAVAEAFDLEQQPREKIVAVLHDVLEDSDVSYKALIGHFGVAIADAVRMLTHPPQMSYADYIINICDDEGYGDNIAKFVKMADLRHNLSDLNDPKKHKQRRDKYQLALRLLEAA